MLTANYLLVNSPDTENKYIHKSEKLKQRLKSLKVSKIPNTKPMIKTLCLVVLISLCTIAFAQSPEIEWQKSLGGTGKDVLQSIEKTNDGGFIVAGYSNSNNGDVTGNHGEFDYWVAKLTNNGIIVWQKSLGGSGEDIANSVIQTSDGGYIVSGQSYSDNGDITDNHGGIDYWIVKLDASGNLVWQKSLGGSSLDYGREIQETIDGGFIMIGLSLSNNGDVTGNHGDYDYWVVKMDGSGEIVWQNALGGSSVEQALSIRQTTDGGYVIAGSSRSVDGDVTLNHGSDDCWIVKLDPSGNLSWEKSFGGFSEDFAYSIQQTSEGGYVFAGFSSSWNGDITGNHGGRDVWIVKIDVVGNLIWQKSFGGTQNDIAMDIKNTLDGKYIITGYSNSINGDVTENNGEEDFWVIKIDTSGNIIWQKSFGGSGSDQAFCLEQAPDGGFILAGGSGSNDGNVSGNHGNKDGWLLKLLPESLSSAGVELTDHYFFYPNPGSSFITIQNKNSLLTGFDYKIMDTQGRTVKEGSSVFNERIQVESLKTGYYFLKIITGNNGTSVLKFLKN